MTGPVFIVGTGRCGSTALFRELARHPDVAFPTSLLDRWPGAERLNRMILSSLPASAANRWGPAPSEAYAWWDNAAPGFSSTRRDLTRNDVTPQVAERVRAAVNGLCPPSRPQPFLKVTGWPRMGFLRAIFPTARFVHLVRDGRAVAVSLLQRPWWDGWEGPPTWRVGSLPADKAELWDSSSRSPVALAGLQWWIHMEAFERAKDALDAESYLELRYEELCRTPETVVRRIVDFVGWRWPRALADVDWQATYRPGRDWRASLYPEQAEMLETLLGPALARFGYAATG